MYDMLKSNSYDIYLGQNLGQDQGRDKKHNPPNISWTRYKQKLFLTFATYIWLLKTSHVGTCEVLRFGYILAYHSTDVHARFYNPREVTGARFYFLTLAYLF